MKFQATTLLIVLLALAGFDVRAQETSSGSENSRQPAKQRFTIYYHLGSVELPEGYKGYVTTNWNDAWLGVIESPERNLRISWAGGLVESLFEKFKKNVVESETETTPNYSIRFGLVRDKSEESLIAQIEWLQFSAVVKNDDEKVLFKEIVRSYRKEKCESCLSFRYRSREKKSKQ